MLPLQGFQCFIICLLWVIAPFSASAVSSSICKFPLFHYLFVASLLCSRFRLFHLLFVMSLSYFFKFSIVSLSNSLGLRHYTISSRFHCFIICLLRHCSVFGFDCSIFCLLRNYRPTISSRFSLFRNLFVTSLLCSRLQLSHLLFVASNFSFRSGRSLH